ncbi:MAG TPA: tetratricopeptide repeat protein [Thermoanaerobaculia bacterium]|nr:tetratricopeptide repeat protein [Thermoanaerobaculia bacterium]
MTNGVRHAKAGRLGPAAKAFAKAESLGAESGDEALVDRAMVFRIAVEMEMGTLQGQAAILQRVLLRSHDPEVCFFAAYNTARCYDLERSYKKATFYARQALRWAPPTGSAECEAMAHNMLGNLHLVECQFDDAAKEYERALALMPEAPGIERALVLDNLGYCRLVVGELRAGFSLLYLSLRMLSRLDAPELRPRPRLSLAFGYLEIGRFDHAARQAQAALDEARRAGDETSVKNALYLLGQSHNLEGDEATARSFFCELQRTFYPENGAIPDFLLAIDVRRIIHLKA